MRSIKVKILGVYFENMTLYPFNKIDRICNFLQSVETLGAPIGKA
jgi:hypothetical protein